MHPPNFQDMHLGCSLAPKEVNCTIAWLRVEVAICSLVDFIITTVRDYLGLFMHFLYTAAAVDCKMPLMCFFPPPPMAAFFSLPWALHYCKNSMREFEKQDKHIENHLSQSIQVAKVTWGKYFYGKMDVRKKPSNSPLFCKTTSTLLERTIFLLTHKSALYMKVSLTKRKRCRLETKNWIHPIFLCTWPFFSTHIYIGYLTAFLSATQPLLFFQYLYYLLISPIVQKDKMHRSSFIIFRKAILVKNLFNNMQINPSTEFLEVNMSLMDTL